MYKQLHNTLNVKKRILSTWKQSFCCLYLGMGQQGKEKVRRGIKLLLVEKGLHYLNYLGTGLCCPHVYRLKEVSMVPFLLLVWVVYGYHWETHQWGAAEGSVKFATSHCTAWGPGQDATSSLHSMERSSQTGNLTSALMTEQLLPVAWGQLATRQHPTAWEYLFI